MADPTLREARAMADKLRDAELRLDRGMPSTLAPVDHGRAAELLLTLAALLEMADEITLDDARKKIVATPTTTPAKLGGSR